MPHINNWISTLLVAMIGFSVGAMSYRAYQAHSYRVHAAERDASPATSPSAFDLALCDSVVNCQHPQAYKILILGDSIASFWRHYPDEFARTFGSDAFNSGEAGDTTGNLRWCIDNGEFDKFRPKTILLMIGTNNLIGGERGQKTADDINAIADFLRSKFRCRVLVTSMLPGEKSTNIPPVPNREIDACNASLSRHNGADYIDLWSKVRAQDGKMADRFTTDGVHLTGEGYRIWGEITSPLLK
jgi:lysophospholipase L1-like esterase